MPKGHARVKAGRRRAEEDDQTYHHQHRVDYVVEKTKKK